MNPSLPPFLLDTDDFTQAELDAIEEAYTLATDNDREFTPGDMDEILEAVREHEDF